MYAGVGARETPPAVLEAIELAARRLASAGWTLRTGMSPGADQAFYRGAVAGRGRVELYLPWPSFESGVRLPMEGTEVSVLQAPTAAAYSTGARFHRGWSGLSADARALRARDAHEVLGRDLVSPAALVVCWTKDGSVDGEAPCVGGTGQALRIARDHGIDVLNISRPEHMRRLRRLSAPGS